jgi:hypothetical protein
MEFYVTRLDSACDLVLGLNWLRRYNLLIDWRNTSLKFSPVYDESIVSTLLETIPDPVAVSLVTEMTELLATPTLPLSISLTSSPEPAPSMEIPLEAPMPRLFTSAPLVSMVNVAGFHTIICDKETVKYTLHASPVNETNGFGTSTEPDFANLSGILSEYHDFADVFSESEAYNFLPHHEFDLKIKLRLLMALSLRSAPSIPFSQPS